MDTWPVVFPALLRRGPIGPGFFPMGLGVYNWGKSQTEKKK